MGVAMKNKLAIFDLDGTLFDTLNVNFLSYNQALVEKGFSLDYNYFLKECQGKYYKDFLPQIMGSNDEELLTDIHQRKQNLYLTNINNARKNTHLFSIINVIKFEYNLSVVTTASRKNCIQLLGYFGQEEIFDLIITREDVTKSKPDPEGFLQAMRYFNVEAENTMIFEDSEEGIQAAKCTGAGIFKII